MVPQMAGNVIWPAGPELLTICSPAGHDFRRRRRYRKERHERANHTSRGARRQQPDAGTGNGRFDRPNGVGTGGRGPWRAGTRALVRCREPGRHQDLARNPAVRLVGHPFFDAPRGDTRPRDRRRQRHPVRVPATDQFSSGSRRLSTGFTGSRTTSSSPACRSTPSEIFRRRPS